MPRLVARLECNRGSRDCGFRRWSRTQLKGHWCCVDMPRAMEQPHQSSVEFSKSARRLHGDKTTPLHDLCMWVSVPGCVIFPPACQATFCLQADEVPREFLGAGLRTECPAPTRICWHIGHLSWRSERATALKQGTGKAGGS